jgi:hypothetical protein
MMTKALRGLPSAHDLGIRGVFFRLPLTGPIFMGDNEPRPPTIRILVHEHHENHPGNVQDFVSQG